MSSRVLFETTYIELNVNHPSIESTNAHRSSRAGVINRNMAEMNEEIIFESNDEEAFFGAPIG